MTRRILVTTATLVGCMPLLAEQYAVLAGISTYRAGGSMNLEGPVHDIRALVRTLRDIYAYPDANITVLLNEAATKSNIIGALAERVAQLKANDHLLFYFSGHGTSAYDRNFAPIASYIGPDSGALAPYNLDVSSPEAATESLLIGRRDLRPVLSTIHAEAQALVIIDACYSENATKTIGSLAAASARGINLSSLLPKRETISGRLSGTPSGVAVSSGSGAEPYPYSNVIALAAASRNQPALDLNTALIRQGNRTFDGRPHGAFTNSFMLALLGSGDTNRDGLMSYDELYRFIRRDMERFPQLPQILAPAGVSLDAPVLGSRRIGRVDEPSSSVASKSDGIRIRLEEVAVTIRDRVERMKNVQIVDMDYALVLRQTGNFWELFDASGTLIRSYGLSDSESLLARIATEARLSDLLSWRYASQPFNVRLDVQPAVAQGYDRYRATYRVGEPLNVRISSERPAWLLLLNIDKSGYVSVLFPGASAWEQKVQPAGRVLEIPGIRVQPPAGSEHLKLFAFDSMPADWAQWTCSILTVGGKQKLKCPEFGSGDRRMYDLLNMIRAGQGSAAETSLRVVTHD